MVCCPAALNCIRASLAVRASADASSLICEEVLLTPMEEWRRLPEVRAEQSASSSSEPDSSMTSFPLAIASNFRFDSFESFLNRRRIRAVIRLLLLLLFSLRGDTLFMSLLAAFLGGSAFVGVSGASPEEVEAFPLSRTISCTLDTLR